MGAWRGWTARGTVPRVGAALALLAVLAVTLSPHEWQPRQHVQLHPLHSIRSDFRWLPLGEALAHVGGNVALFVPFGFFLLLASRRSVPWVTAVGLVVSLLVETAQYAIGTRVCDVDDVLLNTAGALLGALAAVAMRRIARRRGAVPVLPGR